jgi:hypothetical protein
MSRLIRLTIVVGALAALAVPLAASAHGGKRGDDDRHRLLYATDTRGNLLSFSADNPRRVRSTAITGLPAGVSPARTTSATSPAPRRALERRAVAGRPRDGQDALARPHRRRPHADRPRSLAGPVARTSRRGEPQARLTPRAAIA